MKTRKIGAGLTAGFLLAATLASCGTGGSSSPAATTPLAATASATTAATAASQAGSSVSGHIVFMSNRTDLTDKFTQMSAAFTAKYPNASVEIQQNNDLAKSLKLMVGTNTLPDVFEWDSEVIPMDQLQLLPENLLPLDDLGYTADTVLSYDTWYTMYEGKHYGIFESENATGLLASKKTLASCGITTYPTTLDELYADLDKIKAKGLTPMASMLKTGWPLGNWDTVDFANGYLDWVKTEISTDAPYTMDSPMGKKYSFLLDLVNKGYFDQDMMSSDWDVVRKQMDKYGMLMLASYGLTALEDANGPVDLSDVAFFALPVDNSGKPVSLLSGGWNIGIAKNTKSPETAKAFFKFLLEDSGYVDMIGGIPSVKSVKTTNPALQAFLDSKPTFYDRNSVDENSMNMETKIQNQGAIDYGAAQQGVMTKTMTIQATLDNLNTQWGAARKALGLS